MKRAMVLVLDSFGIGASEDAGKFGDEGANTLLSIARECAAGRCEDGRSGKLNLPNLQSLGLGAACTLSCGDEVPFATDVRTDGGAWGFAAELSTAKDTTSGHWEMMGVPVLFDWGYFRDRENSFPTALIDALVEKADLSGVLGNCIASGTDIIKRLGEEHLATGKPICYTSADSVFQIAYHESVWSKARAEEVCNIARGLLDDYRIARVIARPFVGDSADTFQRTYNRRDYSMPSPTNTLLDELVNAGGDVVGVGKIADIFAHKGVSTIRHASGLKDLMGESIKAWNNGVKDKLVFTNLVDFDTRFGHRRDVNGYAKELEAFDKILGQLLPMISPDDLLIITADHGCDPTFAGTDHTREHVPVLVKGCGLKGSLAKRESFADIGQSLAEFFGLKNLHSGTSFMPQSRPASSNRQEIKHVHISH